MLFGIMHGWDGPRYFTIVRKKTSISFGADLGVFDQKIRSKFHGTLRKRRNRPPGFACVGRRSKGGHAASGTPAAFVRRKSLGNRFYGRTAGLPAASDLFRELPPAGPKSAPRNIRDTDESLVRSDGTLRNVIDRAQFSAFAETTGANTSRARVAGERLFQNKEKSVLIFPAQRGSAELSDDPVTSCKNQRE